MENMVDAEAIRSAILLLSFNIVHWHYLGEIAHDSSMRHPLSSIGMTCGTVWLKPQTTIISCNLDR